MERFFDTDAGFFPAFHFSFYFRQVELIPSPQLPNSVKRQSEVLSSVCRVACQYHTDNHVPVYLSTGSREIDMVQVRSGGDVGRSRTLLLRLSSTQPPVTSLSKSIKKRIIRVQSDAGKWARGRKLESASSVFLPVFRTTHSGTLNVAAAGHKRPKK